MADTSYDVHVIREFDAPIERVWAAWTEPADLQQWWGPTGFECTHAEADIRSGGRIFVTMKAPAEYGGFEQHSTWNITEVDAPRLLRYVHRFADADGNRISPAEAGIPDGVPSGGHHEVELTALENGRTRLEMTEHGYTTVEARDLSLGGLEQCLDKMAALVNDGPWEPT
jgi:uncharacterized protein YndB with AHSA1/START domain